MYETNQQQAEERNDFIIKRCAIIALDEYIAVEAAKIYAENKVTRHRRKSAGHQVVFNTKNYIFVLRLHLGQRRNGYTNYAEGAMIFSN